MRNAWIKLLFNIGLVVLFFGLGACSDEPQIDLNEIGIDTELKRFDQAFFESDTANFEQALKDLERDYLPFFSSKAEFVFWENQRRDPLQLELYSKVKSVFGDMSAYEQALNDVVKRYYYYFGEQDSLKVYSYISRLDFNFPIVLSPPYLFVATDMYLGEPGKEFYASLPQYLQFERQEHFLLRDIAYALALNQVKSPEDPASLLEQMIYHGKVLYTAKRLYPAMDEAQLLKYPESKLRFSEEHEKEMWVYFIENELLFKSSQELSRRFLDVAPFSKFRTDIDQETPGRIGRWFGYKIVKAYAEEAPIENWQELLAEDDARKILKLSGYKP